MKLNELFGTSLNEEEITVTAPEDVWAQNKDSSKTYISSTTYGVKKLEGGLKFEVTTSEGNERKPFANLTKLALDQSFTPVRPNQNPDAEGYTSYRKVDEIEAFKYTADTVKLNGVLISKGDYLIRTPKGDQFTYEVKKSKDFEASFTEK